MKKTLAMLLALVTLLTCSAALADTARAKLSATMPVYAGPGEDYTYLGADLSAGRYVIVRTKVWNDVTNSWWVQVEYATDGSVFRLYTDSAYMTVKLDNVPEENPLRYTTTLCVADAYAGPGLDYARWSDNVLSGLDVTLLEVAGGFGHIEYWWEERGEYRRVWVALNDLRCGDQYTSADETYGAGGVQTKDAVVIATPTPAPTATPKATQVIIATPAPQKQWPVGEWCTIRVNEVYCRTRPGADQPAVDYAYRGGRYCIYGMDEDMGGVTWYQISIGGQYLWVPETAVTIGQDASTSATTNKADHAIGETCVVVPESGNVRGGPGTEHNIVGYVSRGQRFEIFDTAVATNGRTWFKIWIDGRYAWIAAGITTVNGAVYH